MIKILFNTPRNEESLWHWSKEPFPALRALRYVGNRDDNFRAHYATQAVANGFVPAFKEIKINSLYTSEQSDDYCKVIVTKKGTKLLVPCEEYEDEKILLISAFEPFIYGYNSRVQAVGAEIINQALTRGGRGKVSKIQLVVRLTDPEGYVWLETRNKYYGIVEMFSWARNYLRMPKEEFEVGQELGLLF